MGRSAFILFAACLALACRASRPDSGGTAPRAAAARWHPLDAAARRDARLRGVWEAEGYGHLVVIADDVRVFHHADGFCVADPGLVPAFALYSLADGGARLSLLHEDYGFASEELQSRVDLRRLEALPARCAAPAESATSGAVFDALATLMDEHYAFFAERGVEWAPLRERYRPLASRASDPDSLFPVLRDMLGHVNDGHLNLSRRGGPAFNAGQPALRERLIEAWRREGMTGASGEYVSSWHQRVVGSVHPLLDAGSRREGAAGALEWGTIGDSVAYVRVNRFSGFTRDDAPRPAQLDSLRAALDRMLADVGGAKAAIVDVAMNGGGMDAAAILVARRFADRERAALTKQVRDGRPQGVVLRPEGARQFTRPVVLLTSEITASAAEVFVLMMRALPHVTHAGERTRGILSGLLPKPLPGGYMVTLSHQTVRDAEGRLFEATGVPPREEIVLFPEGREATGLADAIRGVAGRLAQAKRRP
jgi:carboxyl-terminal processing protease